ncbi:MAG: DNA primase [Synergistaceae bacterium]|nr:DNA primase [Synergistaceae bacterium]
MNNNEIINQIKDSLDIADVIGEKVKLRRSARGFMGLCPFHNEDTPSFYVYTDSQSYYCFGCKAAGDIFSYVMKSENLAFPEALRLLADRAGIKLPSYHRENTDAYSVLDLAAKFFTDCLRSDSGTAARVYMSRRNLTDDDIGRYYLGYSPNSWDALTKFLRSKKIPDKAVLDSGLAVQNSRGLYDRFRGRLMFPIRDITGKVIAFGGRIIDGEGAKYINSPEGPIYSKRRNLYLLDKARTAIREKGRSILVEGYMDALRLHKCGFTESVASLGTSLTAEQAGLLSRYADRCYICYDSDTAGQNAAIKGMYILAEHGLSVYVADVPDGKDPDEFLCSSPPEMFEAALTSAKPLILKHIDFIKPALHDDNTRRSALDELFGSLKRLDPDDVLKYLGSICEVLMLPPEYVKSRLFSDTPPENQRHYPERRQIPRQTQTPKIAPVFMLEEDPEAEMCALLWNSQDFRISIDIHEAVSIMNSEQNQAIVQAILSENTEDLEPLWLTLGETDKIAVIKRGENLMNQRGGMTDTENFLRVYSILKRRSIERRIAEFASMPLDAQNVKELTALYAQREKFSL